MFKYIDQTDAQMNERRINMETKDKMIIVGRDSLNRPIWKPESQITKMPVASEPEEVVDKKIKK
jgi:hypothetical protein